MQVWRLTSGRHASLDGEGARRVGGRWNSPGHAVVYTSESLALCLAEALVHVTGVLPTDYMSFHIELPDEQVEILDAASLKRNWQFDVGYTRAIGDEWLELGRSLVLAVPSMVLAASTNYLINPLHSAAAGVRILARDPFRFDPRLRRR